jgi:hypothetical protein
MLFTEVTEFHWWQCNVFSTWCLFLWRLRNEYYENIIEGILIFSLHVLPPKRITLVGKMKFRPTLFERLWPHTLLEVKIRLYQRHIKSRWNHSFMLNFFLFFWSHLRKQNAHYIWSNAIFNDDVSAAVFFKAKWGERTFIYGQYEGFTTPSRRLWEELLKIATDAGTRTSSLQGTATGVEDNQPWSSNLV